MRIDEVSQKSGLTADTIRFYEQSGMLPAISRDDRGWRRFTPDDLDWLIVLSRLRSTGMPLKDVRAFASSAQGAQAETLEEQRKRLQILQNHAGALAQRKAELDACETYLKHKISTYTAILDK